MNPEVGTLEDLDEGRPVHMKGKKKEKLNSSDAKEGKCDSEIVSNVETQLFEKAAHA